MPTERTSFDKVYDRFFLQIEEDTSFFDYWELDDEESEKLAKKRAEGLLVSAVDELMSRTTPDVDFTSYDLENQTFEFALTFAEINLLARLMLKQYLERDIAKLRSMINVMTASDIKTLYSPANERTSFMNMYNNVRRECDVLISEYESRDRLTGKRRSIFDG